MASPSSSNGNKFDDQPPSSSINQFLTLPEITLPVPRRTRELPFINFSKSIIMMSSDYVNLLCEKAEAKEAAEVQRQRKQAEAQATKARRAVEKAEKDAVKLQRAKEKIAKKAFTEQ
jgi:hypothetical protein